MEGSGFSCSTSLQFTYCPPLPLGGLDPALEILTEHSPELWKIKIGDPILDQLTEQLYRELLPQLSEFRKTGSIHLSRAQRTTALSLLDLYAQKAGPALRQKLLNIKSEI